MTPNYCEKKFNSITDDTRRLYLIDRCSHLSTLPIHWTADRSRLKQADLLVYYSDDLHSNAIQKLIRNDQQQQFSAVYILESEVNSRRGENWHEIDFPIWYNLKRSYPE